MKFLYKVLVGATPKGRHTEQHDVFFGIGDSLQNLVPQLKAFWPEAENKIHVDAFRTVTKVGNFQVLVVEKNDTRASDAQLFFINLGGYKKDEFEEFHYKMIVAAPNKARAIQEAKQTAFYKHTGFKGAPSHIDDKYGVDVDDVFEIEDILAPALKTKFKILVKENNDLLEDEFHLGYFKMSKIEKGDYTPSE